MENDYKLMYSPSDDFCNDEVRKYFRNQAKGAINIEQYNGSLLEPRWLYSQYKGMVLWGMAIMNKMLSSNNTQDYTGRDVRGFFGIVFKKGAVQYLPKGIDFFKQLYEMKVSPFWNSGKEEFRHKGVELDLVLPDRDLLSPYENRGLSINTDRDSTVILGDEKTDFEYISAAMAINCDVSIITGLVDKAHAFDHQYNFFNAIVLGNHSRDICNHTRPYTVPVNVQTQIGASEEPEIQKRSKKALRPRYIRGMALALLIILVGMCVRVCKQSTNSTSGEVTEGTPVMEKSQMMDSEKMPEMKKKK